jgi:hypothetical protein
MQTALSALATAPTSCGVGLKGTVAPVLASIRNERSRNFQIWVRSISALVI